MKSLTKISPDPGQKEYNVVNRDATDTYIHPKSPYPTDGSLFLLDEDANVLDKNVDSYPAGTIKAYGFKAGDGNYYAVDAEAIPDKQYWGGYLKKIESLPSFTSSIESREDYNGYTNTLEIIKALDGYNDGYTTGAPAAEACRSRTFNGKQGFLPSFGQLNDFYVGHWSEIDSLAIKFSLDAFPRDYGHWSSTSYSTYYSWSIHWSTGMIYPKRNTEHWVRAFFAL